MSLAWPIAVSMVSYSLMTLADTLFVGRLGPEALAGVGIGGTASFAVICFAFGTLRGVKVEVAHDIGRGRREGSREILAAGLWIAVGMGLLVTAITMAIAHALPLLTASVESGLAARSYLVVRALGAPLVLVYVALREYRYGLGDSQAPMRAALVGNVVNIGLDWLFIYVLDWGVAGAAWATIIGQGFEAALLLAAQRFDGITLRTTRAHIARVLGVGAPIGVQFMLEMGAFATLAAMLAALSDIQMAAHQIALQVVHFAFLPILSVSEAVAVLSGQAMGARRHTLVLRIARKGMWLASGYAILWTVVLFAWPRLLVSAFTDDAALSATTVRLFYVMAAFQLLDAANAVARGALQGVRDVRYAAVVGIATAWAMTPPLTWLLGWQLGWGALGGWIGLSLEILLGAVLLWRRLLSGRWRYAARLARVREKRRARERAARSRPRLTAQIA